MDTSRLPGPGGTFIDVLKVGIIVLVLLVLLLGLPLGMLMPGTAMCPDCGILGSWGAVCIALLGSLVLLVHRRAGRLLAAPAHGHLLLLADRIDRPPRAS
jgi:hypothetical protein